MKGKTHAIHMGQGIGSLKQHLPPAVCLPRPSPAGTCVKAQRDNDLSKDVKCLIIVYMLDGTPSSDQQRKALPT